MSELHINDYIYRELSPDKQEIAIDFVQYSEEKSLAFYRDNCDYQKDKIYYWAKFIDKCVCFISIKDPDEAENHWTIWSDDIGSQWLENYLNDNEFKEVAWKHVDHCGHCGACTGGQNKITFWKGIQ